jgi:hypothetical protein
LQRCEQNGPTGGVLKSLGLPQMGHFNMAGMMER